jgi:hypothetical protein
MVTFLHSECDISPFLRLSGNFRCFSDIGSGNLILKPSQYGKLERADFFGELCLEGADGFSERISEDDCQLLKYTDAKIASHRPANYVVRNFLQSKIQTSSHYAK